MKCDTEICCHHVGVGQIFFLNFFFTQIPKFYTRQRKPFYTEYKFSVARYYPFCELVLLDESNPKLGLRTGCKEVLRILATLLTRKIQLAAAPNEKHFVVSGR